MESPISKTNFRDDFPILRQEVNGKPLAYLDNAATTQKPQMVIDRLSGFFQSENANIHRGVHYLSMQATDAYQRARKTVSQFLNARSAEEILFVRGTTEAINLVARSFGAGTLGLGPGDEILVTVMEHHANIVPWQMIAGETGAKLVVAPMTDEGAIDMEAFERKLTDRTRMISVIHVSNVLGSVNPVKEMVRLARERGIPVLLDGAQAVAHMPVDVQDIDCDFYAFSSHKLFGPDGVGVLYGKKERLQTMPPYHGGGDMIERVSFEKTTFRQPPERFEAGTPNISGAIGLATAIHYLQSIGWETIHQREEELLQHANSRLGEIPGVTIQGTVPGKASVVSFSLDSVHPHDVSTILDTEGIAVRGGHHCAQPLMERLGVTGTTRASLSFYNTTEEVDRLADGLVKVSRLFGEG